MNNYDKRKLLDKTILIGDLSDIAQVIEGYFYDGLLVELTADIVRK